MVLVGSKTDFIMIQLEGNLIHAYVKVSRDTWVAIQAPSKLYLGTQNQHLYCIIFLISKYGATQSYKPCGRRDYTQHGCCCA